MMRIDDIPIRQPKIRRARSNVEPNDSRSRHLAMEYFGMRYTQSLPIPEEAELGEPIQKNIHNWVQTILS